MSSFKYLLKCAVFTVFFLLIFIAKTASAQVVFNEPNEATEYVWAPSVTWNEYSVTCEYSYNNVSYTSIACDNYGMDIPAPLSNGNYTLYARGFDVNNNESVTSTSFVFEGYGCLDSNAINYNASASIDDGSCYYIAINSPTAGSSVSSWSPSVSWGAYSPTTCQYNFDGGAWVTADCTSAGSDIAAPGGTGSTTLYVESSGGSGSYNTSVNFSYNPVTGVSINQPTDGGYVTSWSPSVSWDTFTQSCEYSYNNTNWTSVSCASGGVDIGSPGGYGTYTLYVRGFNGSDYSYASVGFTFDPGGVTYGCTDSYAINYNMNANADDGSCYYIAINTPSGGTVNTWEPNVNWGVSPSFCEYQMNSTGWQSVNCGNGGSDIGDPGFGTHTLEVKATNPSVGQVSTSVNFTYDSGDVYGCMDSNAINYNASANIDDGSCILIQVNSPTDAEVVTSWGPSVNFGAFGPTACYYSYNGSTWNIVTCGNSGTDIPAPGQGSATLYVKSEGTINPSTSVTFTYDPIIPVTISSPTSNQIVTSFAPSVSWGDFSSGCEYSYDGDTYYTIGSCTVNPTVPVPDSVGTSTLYLRGSDGSSYSTASVTFNYAPLTATPNQPDLDAVDDTGGSNTDNVTSVYSALTIRGGGTNGTVVSVCKGGCSNQIIDSFTINDVDGYWAYNLPILADGTHSITVRYQEPGKSVSLESTPLVITVDTTVPVAPGTPDLQSAFDTGYSNTDNITTSATGTFDVTCEVGTMVQLYFGGIANTQSSCSSGTVSLALTGSMSEASYNFTAKQTDTAGNVSEVSNTLVVTRDITAPVISSIASSTSNISSTITWNTNESATSTVEYGATTEYGSASSSSALVTSHSINLTGLSPQTTYNYRVSSTDAAGNRSVSTNKIFQTTFNADSISPTVSSAIVNGNTLSVVFTEALSSTSTPLASTFTVNGSAVTVSSVSVSGTTVTLTLSASVSSTDTITLSYIVPLTGMLQDPSGNEVAGFSNRSVTNETQVETVVTEQPRVGAVAVATQQGFNSYSFAPQTVLVLGTKVSGQFGPAIYVTGVINETTGAPMNNGYGGLTNTFAFDKNATLGTRNDEVINLQRFLNAQGFRVNTVDGRAGSPGYESSFFGSLTRKALAEFQKVVGISPVGYFGPKTRAFINNFLEKNAPAK